VAQEVNSPENALHQRGSFVHQCPICGKQLEPGTRFCPDDGVPLTETASATVRTPSSLNRE
jgi:hypothetical protein